MNWFYSIDCYIISNSDSKSIILVEVAASVTAKLAFLSMAVYYVKAVLTSCMTSREESFRKYFH